MLQNLADGLVVGSIIGLGAVGLTVAYALLRFANADRQAWPSLRTLGELLQLDPTYVRRQLLQMELLGYLAIDRSGISQVQLLHW